MLTHFGADLLRPEWRESVVCIGTFDGVHLGHREVIGAAVRRAAELEVPSVLVTFDRHPAATLAPERVPLALGTLDQNVALIRSAGVSVCVILAFDRALADMTAGDFLEHVLKGKLHARELVVGHDFALGRGREGTTDWLRARIETTVLPPFERDGHRVSSSEIRNALAVGNPEHATRLLGRHFAMSGVVVGGLRLGRQLGYPTANLARSGEQLVPQFGVYAGYARTLRGRFRSAMSVGVRPTVDGKGRTIEAYLLDYPGDSLYGQAVEFEFVRKLRDEIAFPSLDALKERMAEDVALAAGLPEP